MRNVPTALLAATLLTLTASASAETMPAHYDTACDDPVFAPRVGSIVPANTPAFPFHVMYGEYAFAIRRTSFELVDTHLDADPFKTGGQLLLPLAPLGEGSYELHFNSPCNPSYVSPDHSQARVFSVGPAQPLPKKAGTLTIVDDTTTEDAEYCVDVRASRRVRIDIDPLLVPFLATTQVSLSEPLIASEYGNFSGASQTVVLHAPCEHPSPSGGPPTTDVTLGAHVAGMSDLEPTTLAVSFLCDPAILARCKPGVPPVPDTGPSYADDAGSSGPDFEVPGDSNAQSPPSSSGCSVSSIDDATSAGATTFALGAVLAVLRWARSRRRRAA